jgi:hypothetical protein
LPQLEAKICGWSHERRRNEKGIIHTKISFEYCRQFEAKIRSWS